MVHAHLLVLPVRALVGAHLELERVLAFVLAAQPEAAQLEPLLLPACSDGISFVKRLKRRTLAVVRRLVAG